jgi:hypothetical protein
MAWRLAAVGRGALLLLGVGLAAATAAAGVFGGLCRLLWGRWWVGGPAKMGISGWLMQILKQERQGLVTVEVLQRQGLEAAHSTLQG